ncbi:uncharacterized protein DEA37_0010285 [Paragonimus westermani]|uniref:C2 domain-containing protein n=1 Tax=Paragonimus westermani TaxID=34504 RepID=A0A5J4NHX7_9TREM|nr:uncharacterized protein DEA37_0010285 [Paragonimus westermani]
MVSNFGFNSFSRDTWRNQFNYPSRCFSRHKPLSPIVYWRAVLLQRHQGQSPLYAARIQWFTIPPVYPHRSKSSELRAFCCGVPNGYAIDFLIGFIQELVMNDDPEHQWIEKIRTSRASNEARQRLFSRLSGELQRKMGVKVLNLGGNSVIGYQLHFDLEGETGVVVRGIGTAVRLHKLVPTRSPPTSPASTTS